MSESVDLNRLRLTVVAYTLKVFLNFFFAMLKRVSGICNFDCIFSFFSRCGFSLDRQGGNDALCFVTRELCFCIVVVSHENRWPIVWSTFPKEFGMKRSSSLSLDRSSQLPGLSASFLFDMVIISCNWCRKGFKKARWSEYIFFF